MKQRLQLIATLAMLAFGGYIGYVTNYTTTVTAHEVRLTELPQIPREQGFNFNIDLNTGVVTGTNSDKDIRVEIVQKDVPVYIHDTLVIEKPTIVYKFPYVKSKTPSLADLATR